jgi:hypothetical protein
MWLRVGRDGSHQRFTHPSQRRCTRTVLRLGMLKKVVRCGVCARVHDVIELVDLKQLVNGTFTFVCPLKQTGGSYQLEQVGTLTIKPAAA